MFRKRSTDDASVDGLVNLLVLDPGSRPMAAQVLQDPWFLQAGAKVKPTNIARL